jgi:hypothetical protein
MELVIFIEEYGFGEKCCSWIVQFICSIHFSVLVNGNSSKFFSSSYGLGQGDSLPPLLFVIIKEDLTKCYLLL